jgi:polyhydroxyalkanoate synthase
MIAVDLVKSIEDTFNYQKKLSEGIRNLLSIEEVNVEAAPKKLIYTEDKMKLYHYVSATKKTICPIPTLVTYALVNRQYMMDLQQDRSVICSWLDQGLDIYIIDWGYPDKADKYLSMEDYIDGYMNTAIDLVRERSGQEQINLLGVCQGGTFSVIYSALYPEKIKNLVTMVAPIDFHVTDGLLNVWSKYIDVDLLVDAYGVIPGDFLNIGFLMMRPFQLMLDKYVGFTENLDNPDLLRDFLRMEKWIFDSPSQAGATFSKFIEDLYKKNLLVQNKLELGGRLVDLKKVTMPLLNVFAEKDHLVPPSSSRPLNELVGSKDTETLSFPGGHIGIYVSSKSQKEVAPAVAKWLLKRSGAEFEVETKGKKEAAKS